MARFQQTAGEVDFGIADPVVPVKMWEGGSANKFQLDGRLTLGGQPVAGAVLKANQYTLPAPTDADGAFSIRRDQSVVDRTTLSISDVSQATVGGTPLSDADAVTLTAATFAIETAFTITLDGAPSLTKGQKNVEIGGTVLFSDGTTPIPPVALWGYTLSGTVYDANQKPLAGVYASIRDEEGETWALSNETGNDGAYQLRFFPDSAESDYIVRIAYGEQSAENDEGLTLEAGTSSKLDLVLHTDMAMVMGTGPNGAFAPEAIPGAEYVGYLVGLAVNDAPITATFTWPDENGHFSVVIPEVNFDGEAAFFQERIRFFSDVENIPGSDVPADLIPAQLDARTPRNIPPVFSLS
jgi:hypothetical protein